VGASEDERALEEGILEASGEFPAEVFGTYLLSGDELGDFFFGRFGPMAFIDFLALKDVDDGFADVGGVFTEEIDDIFI
jgi:hypothetical protein